MRFVFPSSLKSRICGWITSSASFEIFVAASPLSSAVRRPLAGSIKACLNPFTSPSMICPRATGASNTSRATVNRPGPWKARRPYFARIGTMNREGAVGGQPSRLSSRASRPRQILGRDAPSAGGTPAPLPRGSWKGRRRRPVSLGEFPMHSLGGRG